MSGRIYDIAEKAKCLKCGGDAFLSRERNFNGPQCKKCGSNKIRYVPTWNGFEATYFYMQWQQ